MEPNNIEEFVKISLKESEITPSAEAREHLIAVLNGKPKKKKTPWLYYGIAASIVLFFSLLGVRLLSNNLDVEQPAQITIENRKSDIKPNDVLVDQEIKKQEDSHEFKVSPSSNKHVFTHKNAKNIAQINSEIYKDSSKPIRKANELVLKLPLNLVDSSRVVAKSEIRTDTTEKEPLKHFSYITAKELMATVVNDSTTKFFEPNTKTPATYLNSNQLLVEMERQLFDEANKSIFKRTARQLKKIKTSVANRNFKN
ncbi:hypothetical protein [Winogradskyella luteola]|uniref:Uncharacterized protein n=1 Tax=Winogradskyella luteola TaxID=2828330 RepID=A0A9X1FAX7_9FLAO|nr:hypothetical protein [Winogradskyella luteola]MBV7270511.1 hypothetical protein [Winogradskyella luteola]